MKKWAPFLLLAAVMIVLFVFTPFTKQEHDKKKTNLSGKKVQLIFWRNNGNELENEAYRKLIKDFEKANPHISIDMKLLPYSDYEIRLRTELATGDPPDLMAIDSPTLALYANTGSLLSLDFHMKTEGELADYPRAALEGMSYKDKIYIVPITESGIALFYNKKLFAAKGIPFPSADPGKPMTWEETARIAKQLTDGKKGIIGIDPAQGFSDGESAAYFKLPFLWQFGGDVLSPDGKTATGYIDSEDSLKALQFYQDLYHKDHAAAMELPADAILSGKLGMSVLGSWAVGEIFKNEGNIGVAPLPRAKYQAVPNGGWAIGISSRTKHQAEAWTFIKYLTSREGVKKYVQITGDIPVRMSVAKDFPDLNTYPKNIFVYQAQNHSKNRPVTPAYPVISQSIKALFEEVGIGRSNVRDAAREAARKINDGLKEVK
ncbi:sugar ABC transporter substrate-binding protein [Bacillus sp. FJAT-42376]|uniref:ABC transporter substrate-binding protein n=1 Tax=Bacillus sp. FJAT-42376 TaxID=2014076 RepID=UPI000F4D5F17|nr:sugar ABC transporter substrate-binding protein [Bacillus sp. FJAT-42376]AZB44528.1 sugar ABC transporter substrate-binding protein [Bacillus sp. FJAT-42376]